MVWLEMPKENSVAGRGLEDSGDSHEMRKSRFWKRRNIISNTQITEVFWRFNIKIWSSRNTVMKSSF